MRQQAHAILDALFDSPDPRDHRLASQMLAELHQSIQVLSPLRNHRKVALFGSARTPDTHPDYAVAYAVSKALAAANWLIITGAGGGIMAAGNDGAGPNNSIGLNIDLPFEQAANAFIKDSPLLIQYTYFFLRKLFFVRESDAVIILPGGFGTFDEALELITLVQTGRCSPRPIILLDHPESDFWANFLDYCRTNLATMIDPSDLDSIYHTHSVAAAVQYSQDFYKQYQSLAYHDGCATLILNHAISSATAIADLAAQGIDYTPPTKTTPALIKLRIDGVFSRLYSVIRMINTLS